MENKFLENKSGRIFCVRQVYKFLPINLGACKPFFYFFLYTTSEEKEYCEALIIQTSYKMQYFTIFQKQALSTNNESNNSYKINPGYTASFREIKQVKLLTFSGERQLTHGGLTGTDMRNSLKTSRVYFRPSSSCHSSSMLKLPSNGRKS